MSVEHGGGASEASAGRWMVGARITFFAYMHRVYMYVCMCVYMYFIYIYVRTYHVCVGLSSYIYISTSIYLSIHI